MIIFHYLLPSQPLSDLETGEQVVHVMIILHHDDVFGVFLLLGGAAENVVENGVHDASVSLVQVSLPLRT